MASETPESTQARPAGEGWGPWLRLAAVALALLLLSEALWLWQTWPVRELLQPPVAQRSPGTT
jgi:hypothetical protein